MRKLLTSGVFWWALLLTVPHALKAVAREQATTQRLTSIEQFDAYARQAERDGYPTLASKMKPESVARYQGIQLECLQRPLYQPTPTITPFDQQMFSVCVTLTEVRQLMESPK